MDFASAASPVAVCGFCRSTLARDGDALRRIGRVAELFDDHSPLQLGAAGRHGGQAFTLVGRLQMAYGEGRWNEWALLLDDGRRGWLSEDNGRHVLGFDAPLPAELAERVARSATLATGPALNALWPLGATVPAGGQRWQVASLTEAVVASAEGELPAPPAPGALRLLELRNPAGQVATVDLGPPPPAGAGTGVGTGAGAMLPGALPGADAGKAPHAQPGATWSVGQAVDLVDLQLTGLRSGEAERTVAARSAECPSCGTALNIQLDSTQTIVCHQCRAVVDVSQGVGGDLAFQQQTARPKWPPLIPLGATGRLALDGPARDWQVVGFVERWEEPEDADDEPTPWQEYLLYHRGQGFAFLVQAEDGWSWAVPITGVPVVQGDLATWGGQAYGHRYSYRSRVHFVQGEFYWRVAKDQVCQHTDYGTLSGRLNREASGQELTWSVGQVLPAAMVRQAFGLKSPLAQALGSDAQPTVAHSGAGARSWLVTVLLLILVLVVLAALVGRCSQDECDRQRQTFGADSAEYQECRRSAAVLRSGPRTSGGSWGGGYSGGHK